MKLARLAALCTGRLYYLGDTTATHACYMVSRPRGHRAAANGIEPSKFRLVA